MKTIVIYKSLTGFTTKYAKWIGDTLNCNVISYTDLKSTDLSDFEVIIYGGSLYASGVLGFRRFLKRKDLANAKHILIFAVGATPLREGLEEELGRQNIPSEYNKKCKLFYLRGGFEYKKLKAFDRLLMLLLKLKISLKSPDKRNADERGMLAAYDNPADFTKLKNIQQLVAYYKSLSEKVVM